MPSPTAHPQPTSLPETAAIIRISDQLTTALRRLIDTSPLRGLGPIEIARTLEVDKTLASRLLTALRAADPVAALGALPGAAPLRHFIRAARDHGAGGNAVRAAERELRLFEQELQRTFGTRTRLDAAIADALPHARRRQQVAARQAVYRGVSLTRGVSIDLISTTWLLHPSADDPDRLDITVLAAFIGVRRLRPTARVRIASSHARADPGAGASLLTDFCRPADLSIAAMRDGQLTFYEIATGPIRRDAAADVILTESLRDAAPRHAAEPGRVYAFGDAVAHACKRLSLTLLLHPAAWPDADFSLHAFDTAIRGLVQYPDPTREPDRIALDASIARTRADADFLRATPVPNYAAILERLMAPRGSGPDESWRAFALDLLYPLYGSQVVIARE